MSESRNIKVTLELPKTDKRPVVLRGTVFYEATESRIIIDNPGELTTAFLNAMAELIRGGKR